MRYIFLFFFVLPFGVFNNNIQANSFSDKKNQLNQAIENDSKEEIQKILLSNITEDKNETIEWSLVKAIANKKTDAIKESAQKIVTEGKNCNTSKQLTDAKSSFLGFFKRGLLRGWRALCDTSTQLKNAVFGSDKNKLTPLFQAINMGDIDTVKKLIDSGADINQKCAIDLEHNQPITPLEFAIEKREKEIVKLLLNNGAQYKTQ